MPTARRIAEAVFILLMAAGAMTALYAFNAAAENYLDAAAIYGGRAWEVRGWDVLAVGGTAVLEFLVTAAFAIVYAWRGSNLLAPFAYLWSYLLLGAGFFLALLAIGKRGVAPQFLWIAPVYLVLVLIVTVPSLVWNYRNSRKA